MAEIATLARPYAEAVFELANQGETLPTWSGVLATLAEAAAHADVKARIDDPNLTADQLYGLFASVASQELGADQQNFLRLLVANDRLALLPHIHLQFEALKN